MLNDFIKLLISNNIISEEEGNKLSKKFNSNLDLLEFLIKNKKYKKEQLGKLYGDYIGFAYINLDKTIIKNSAVKKLEEEYARKYCVLPIYDIDNVITVATCTPDNLELIKKLELALKSKVSPVFTLKSDIVDYINIYYKSPDTISNLGNNISKFNIFDNYEEITLEQLEKISKDNYMINFNNCLLFLAIKERASDIHIDPQEDGVYIRFRIDGVIMNRVKLESRIHAPLISSLKIMANLDISEKRKPQDGRLVLELSNKNIDFRVSTIPTIYGEKMVLRVLGQIIKNEVPDLKDLNFSKYNYEIVKKIVDTPNGIFFVTGPTGSGKTTTLFSVLKYLNKPSINILTIEDPVEYRLKGINQVQVNHKAGLDFATALRAFLRQDPDVILIGEIRDYETARIASQAALTGHLVLATMHTNNALQAVTRLIEIGVEPFLVAPSIIGVLNQRLVRRLCDSCKVEYYPDKSLLDKYFILNEDINLKLYKPSGCEECNDTGYLGRIALHEIFLLTGEIRDIISKKGSILDIEKAAKKREFKTLMYDGLKKVLMGLTTIEEVERVSKQYEEY